MGALALQPGEAPGGRILTGAGDWVGGAGREEEIGGLVVWAGASSCRTGKREGGRAASAARYRSNAVMNAPPELSGEIPVRLRFPRLRSGQARSTSLRVNRAGLRFGRDGKKGRRAFAKSAYPPYRTANGKAGGWTRGFGSTLPKQCSKECAARTERRDPRSTALPSTALPSTTLGTGPFDFAQGKQGRPSLRSG